VTQGASVVLRLLARIPISGPTTLEMHGVVKEGVEFLDMLHFTSGGRGGRGESTNVAATSTAELAGNLNKF